MQDVLAPPRDTLDADAVLLLLQGSPVVQITYGVTALDQTFNAIADISEFVEPGSTVASDITATIHRTCNLIIDTDATVDDNGTPFNYLAMFAQPFMTLTSEDGSVSARFNLGVYTLATPTYDNSTSPSAATHQGYDLLFLLNQPVGDSYEISIGQDPVAAAANLISSYLPNATVQLIETTEVLQRVKSYPFDSDHQFTYLQIVNDLLATVGYEPVWVDWDGNFQLKPYIDPMTAPYEYFFNINDDDNIIATPRTATQDLFDIPNWWRFVMQNLTTAPVEGSTQFTYQDNQASNPSSTANRPYLVKKLVEVDATSYSTLQAQALVQIAIDLSPAEQFAVALWPFPLFWHKDVIHFKDPNVVNILPAQSDSRRCVCVSWTLTLDANTDMTCVWQAANTGIIAGS